MQPMPYLHFPKTRTLHIMFRTLLITWVAIHFAHCSNEPIEPLLPPVITPSVDEQKTEESPVPITVLPMPIKPENAIVASNELFIRVVKSTRPAVVNIVAIAKSREPKSQINPFFDDPFFHRFFGDEFGQQFRTPQERQQRGMGSGVIVSSNGYILTNNHVIDQADEIRVVFGDKTEFEGTLIGTDPKTDLAIIKIDATDLPVLPWGNSDQLQVGEMVMAIGNPFGLNQTVTMGIISAVGRANMGIVDYEDFIQTDAAINPGNSGGALINLRGQLIGINTAIFSRSGGYMGIGFAIPSRMAKTVMTSLIKHGEVIRGWLGVSIQNLDAPLAEQFDAPNTKGVLIGDVIANSPAEKAQLQRGDIIKQYRDMFVEDSVHLRSLVAETSPGTSVLVEVFRNGTSHTLTVKIGTLPKNLPEVSSSQSLHPLAGIVVGPIQHGQSRGSIGVIVRKVPKNSPSEQAGLRQGDILLEINREKVSSVKSFNHITRKLKPHKPALVLLRRGNTTVFLTITP